MSEANVSCTVSSFFAIESEDMDPDECTRALGISPWESGKKGTKLSPKSFGLLRTSFWSVGPYQKPADNIDDGLQEVLEVIWPARDRIRAYLTSSGFQASFGTNVSIYEARPLYLLQADTLSRMAFFGVEYIFDVFDYRD